MAAFSSFPFDSSSSSLQLPNTPSFNSAHNSQFPQLHPENPNSIMNLRQRVTTDQFNADSSVAASATYQTTNCTMQDSSSVVTDKYGGGGGWKAAAAIAMGGKKRKCRQGSSANSAQSKDKRRVQKTMKEDNRDDEDKKGKEEKKADAGEEREAPTGYIHVRARRGQATDSHSLAERVRRERISERMKLLQALVPGCDKVTGKALMLDEIINYVQSLQNQVEFLSMKLASVNPMFYDFGMDVESLMISSDQDFRTQLPPALPSIQECSRLPATNINSNNFHLLENSANSIIIPQAQNLSGLAQGSGHAHSLWEMDDGQKHKIINLQSGFISHNSSSLFSSFHL